MIMILGKITRAALPTRYVAYALGEIILIVAGILIAIGVEREMEQRRFEQYERLMLAEISESIKRNREIIDAEFLPRLETKESAVSDLLRIASGNEPPTESVVLANLYKANIDFVFSYDSGAFQSLKATGIERISNERLRSNLINFYDAFLPIFQTFTNLPNEKYQTRLDELNRDIAAPRVVTHEAGPPTIESVLIIDDVRDHPSFLAILEIQNIKARNQRARLSMIIAGFDRMVSEINRELGTNPGV